MTNYREKAVFFTQEVWNNENFQIFEEMIHPDFSYHDPVSPQVNTKSDYRKFIERIQGSQTNRKYTIIDIIAEGNKVVCLYSWEGLWMVEFEGKPPSRKKIEHKGVAIYYFEKEQVIKIWDVWDKYTPLKQVGLI